MKKNLYKKYTNENEMTFLAAITIISTINI
jgi:hypothetical protein